MTEMINSIVPTPPGGDSSNRSASTEFVTNAVATAIAGLPFSVSSTQVDFISGGVGSPANQDYRIIESVPFTTTLNTIFAKLSTGTITAILGINSSASPVTGGTINIGTTQMSASLTAANVMTTGNTLILTVSGTANAPANLSFTVKFTRPLS